VRLLFAATRARPQHYDNDGGDTGEFIEVSGPAGTDLSGYTLVLYNGNGGAPYDTLSLAGAIPDEASSGYGAVSVAATGFQNGAPDGLALVDSDGNLVQFLSYEGAFTAVGGAANGVTSVDVGVSELGTTPVGFSLQLTGTGSAAEDFTWTGPAPASPGAINTGQVLTSSPGPIDPPPVDPPVEPPVDPCATNVSIAQVQGDGAVSPRAGSVLSIEGIVTGVFDNVDLFFVQVCAPRPSLRLLAALLLAATAVRSSTGGAIRVPRHTSPCVSCLRPALVGC
jgi:predicted extracellular nuclease